VEYGVCARQPIQPRSRKTVDGGVEDDQYGHGPDDVWLGGGIGEVRANRDGSKKHLRRAVFRGSDAADLADKTQPA